MKKNNITAGQALMVEKGNHHGLNSYAFKEADGRIYICKGYICFANFNREMLNNGFRKLSELYLAITQAKKRLKTKQYKMFKTYVLFLMKRSVLKDAFITKKFVQAEKEGISFSVDIAGNISHAAMVAVRRGWEFPSKLEAWYLLFKGGVNPNIAFILSYYTEKHHLGIAVSGCGLPSNHEVFGYTNFHNGMSSTFLPPKAIEKPLSEDAGIPFKYFETMHYDYKNPKGNVIKVSDILVTKEVAGEYGDNFSVVDIKASLPLLKAFEEKHLGT